MFALISIGPVTYYYKKAAMWTSYGDGYCDLLYQVIFYQFVYPVEYTS